jgi:hypothetical protein
MWRAIYRAALAFRPAFLHEQIGQDESRPGTMNRAPHPTIAANATTLLVQP